MEHIGVQEVGGGAENGPNAAKDGAASGQPFLGEEFSESVINALPGSFFVVGQDGRMVRWNRNFEFLSGYSGPEVAALNILDFVVQEHKGCAAQAMAKVLVEGGGEIEVDCRTRDGRVLPFYITGRRACIGGTTYVIGTGFDITQRKQAEQRLADERNLLRTLIDNIPDAIYVKDREGRFVLCNREVPRRKAVGSLEEIAGRSDFDFYPRELAERVHASEQEVMRTGRPLLNNERCVIDRATGLPTWNLTTKVPLHNAAGEVVGLVGIGRDITEQKHVESQLRRRLQIEELVAGISTDFANLAAEEIGAGIDRALASIGRWAEADRSYIYMLHDNGTRMSGLYEWHAEGMDPQESRRMSLKIDRLSGGIDRLMNSGSLNIPSVPNLQGHPAEVKELLESMGVKSLLSVPIAVAGRLFGFLGLSAVRQEQSWSSDMVGLLKTVAEIVANALERRRAAEAMQERLAFETLLSDLSATFVNLPDAQIDSEIERWLARIGELLRIDRASVVRFSDSGPDATISHAWAASGLPRASTARMKQSFRWFLERLRRGEFVVFARVEDGPTEAEGEKQYCRQEGIQSILAFPLVVGGARVGGMAFSTIHQSRDWPDDLVQRLRLVGEIFANALLRKQAQEVLRQSEEQFRGIFENTVLGLYRTTPDGRILMANPSLVRMLGYSCFEELAQYDVEKSGYQPGYSRAAFRELIESEGRAVGFESAWTKRDGTPLFVRENAHAVRDEEGNILYYEGTVEDITERKQTERALRESEARFRELAELLPQTVFEMDIGGNFTFVNRAGLEMFGYAEQDVPRSNVLQMFTAADRERAGRNVRKKLAGEPFQDHEYTALRKDARTFPVLLYSSPIVRDAQPVGLRGIVLDISERKRAETALRESEEKFRNLAEQSPNMIFINKMGRVVYANARCEQVMGYTREEFYSADFDFVNLIAPECRERIRDNFSAHMRGQETPSTEYALITKAGWPIEAILTTRLIQYEGDRAILGTVTDITDRKRVEKSLRELQDIINRSPVLVFLWRVVPGIWPVEFVSDNVAQSLGYTADDFVSGRVSWPGITHPDDVPRLEAEVARHLEEGRREWSQEYRLITNAGEVRWFTDQNLALSDVDGTVTHIQSIVLDITERKRMEDALCETERKYRDLYEGSRDGTVAADLDGKILHCNSVFLDMLGYRSDEMATLTYRQIMPAKRDAGQDRVIREQVFTRGYSDVHEEECVRKDGSLFPVEVRLHLSMDNASRPIGMWALVRDISERKRAEAQVRQHLAELTRAWHANTIGEMASGLAHELNQPLCAILNYSNGCLRLSRRERFSIDTLQTSIEQIATQAQRAADIVKRIRGLIAKREPQRAELDLESLVNDTVHLLQSAAAGSHVAIVAKFARDLPRAKGDRVEIAQVLLNLMRNAIEAMSDVDATRRILTISGAPSHERHVEVAVADMGRGVAPELAEKIFESFFTTKDQGLGIGLSLSRRIIESHGGRLWVESDGCSGATFRFTLPVEGAAHGEG